MSLKIRLAQINEQIEQSIKTEGAQHELFLVINRLEEFAKKVDVMLDAVDFNTKREIIRALVKRVEIQGGSRRGIPNRSRSACK